MASRYPNHRLVKIHRSYTADEIANLLHIHKNTVRNWIKNGLPTIDDRRPLLVQGHALIEFLVRRRKQNKAPCGPGRMYCFRCRIPKVPAEGWVVFQPRDEHRGRLIGVCPDCGTRVFRQVSKAKLAASLGELELRDTMAGEHIGNSHTPIVNCDFSKGDRHHDQAQR